LTSGPPPRPSPKCCTSSVNPPSRFRGDDSWLGSCVYPPAQTSST
jgi:hypothetical protein